MGTITKRRRAGATCILTVAAALLPLACSEPEGEAGTARTDALQRPPLLLLAVDGLEWSVLLPLVQAGELPAFEDLMRRGTFGSLRSMVPTSSPVIWTTIATGKSPRKHGIASFTYFEPSADGEQRRVHTSGHRRTKAFWNILSDAGLEVDVIGWWVTYPAEPIRGLMVSQTNTTAALQEDERPALVKGSLRQDVPGQVWPPAEESQVLATLAEVDARLPEIVAELFGPLPHPLPELEQLLWDESQWAFRADETYLRVALRRLERPPAALTALYLGEPDVVAHRFWRYAYPQQFRDPPAPEQVENFGGLLDDAYRRADRALAQLLERMPANTTVLVVSDHGMEAINAGNYFEAGGDRPEILSAHHHDAPPGVLIAAGPGIRSGGLDEARLRALSPAALEGVGSVLDVLPTLLLLLDVPVGADMDGKPMLGVLDSALVQARPLRIIPTHDTPEWLEQHELLRVETPHLEQRLEQLRALGYVR